MNLGIDSVLPESALFTTSGRPLGVWKEKILPFHKRLVIAVKIGWEEALSTGVNKPVY
jgi:hypothetical protein